MSNSTKDIADRVAARMMEHWAIYDTDAIRPTEDELANFIYTAMLEIPNEMFTQKRDQLLAEIDQIECDKDGYMLEYWRGWIGGATREMLKGDVLNCVTLDELNEEFPDP